METTSIIFKHYRKGKQPKLISLYLQMTGTALDSQGVQAH